MADLEINFDDLEEELEKLSKAISVFEPYSKNFIDNTKESFSGFNSDFISKLEETLDNMRDTKAPQLVKDLNTFMQLVTQAKEMFETTDQKYATYLNKEEKNGICK